MDVTKDVDNEQTLFEHYLHEHEDIRIEPTAFPRAPPIDLITI